MSRKKTAVVIDDLELLRTLMIEILEDRGYQVTSFPELHDFSCFRECHCQNSAETPPLDLLITSNRLFPISGIEFVERLQAKNCKQFARNRAILSGSWTEPEKAKAKQLGCQPFEKPFRLETLHAWLDKCEGAK